jgi:starch synthase (maltosyl-transferring)
MARINGIRRDNPALLRDDTLQFHAIDNSKLLCYSKRTPDGSNVVLVVANLDPHRTHAGWTALDLHALGLTDSETYQVHDLLTDARYLWQGSRNFVELRPKEMPAHVLRVRRRVRHEEEFEYYV